MAIKGDPILVTREAGADLSSLQYYVVALNDGARAINGEEALGILQNKPKINEFASIGVMGVMKYRAGGAISIGNKLKVDSNSTIIIASSGSLAVGRALNTVTSGGIGQGLFNFAGFVAVTSATGASS